jgi:hypothetical protein
MSSLVAVLKELGILGRKKGPFFIACEFKDIKFEIEIAQYEYTDFLYVLRFNRTGTSP